MLLKVVVSSTSRISQEVPSDLDRSGSVPAAVPLDAAIGLGREAIIDYFLDWDHGMFRQLGVAAVQNHRRLPNRVSREQSGPSFNVL